MRRALCVSVAADHRAGGSAASEVRSPADVVVAIEPQHSTEELRLALAAATGAPDDCVLELARSGRVPLPNRRIADVDVVDGDALTLRSGELSPTDQQTDQSTPPDGRRPVGRKAVGARAVDASAVDASAVDGSLGTDSRLVVLEVLSGPMLQRSFLLRSGSNRVGRSFEADVQLSDHFVSRHELDVIVDDDGVQLVPVRSANGIEVNGVSIDERVPLAVADVVTVGRTRFVVRRPTVAPGRLYPSCGTIDFFRTPYRNEKPPDPGIERFDAVPKERPDRRLGLIMIFAPLFTGIGLYLVTRRLMFLMFMAMSPIMAIGRYVEDRRTGKKNFRKQVAEFREALATHHQLLVDAHAAERLIRFASSPDLFEIERRATQRSSDLWVRHRGADDFCSLRLGLGAAPTHFEVGVKPGGADELHQEAVKRFRGLERIDEVPITVDLGADRVLGIHGPRAASTSLLSSMIVQAATLHSPEDLQIAVVSDVTRDLDWVKWLPHARPDRPRLDGGNVAVGAAAARALITDLNSIVGQRLDRDGTLGQTSEHWPRWLIVIDGELDLDKVECDRLLDHGPAAGVSVIWLSSTASAIPRQSTTVVKLSTDADQARVWSTDASIAERVFHPELAVARRCEAIARALAPLRDATSALAATGLPSMVPMFDVLGVERPDTDWVRQRWSTADRSGLRGRIGVAANGPVEVDLVHHGPHALIGGTSGAGKSELLQSMVLGLASQHPPHHLNLLFIDYKGGASSQMFLPLPHTVGLVTNLNEAMAMRALESLRAELRYRMTLLEGRAKDLADLARIDPEAPPSLVIICDEFATLVKEIPDFVAGIIDIAQRGRSLGVHLILATQRPAGAVNENILANTNLRIALRTIDKSDSSSIIDTPDAALIAPTDRGRFFMRVGPASLVEVQSSFSGASMEPQRAEPIRVVPFDGPGATAAVLHPDLGAETAAAHSAASPPTTQLDFLVDVIAAAYAETGLGELRKPWRDPLPEELSMSETIAQLSESDATRDRGGAEVVLGIADYPSEQNQSPLIVDLAQTGGMLVFGSGGSGKTTLLKSLAATATGDTEVLVIDGASRPLLGLRGLPNVVDVATADDAESLTRVVCVVERALDARRRGADEPTPLLLLIDDWAQMATNLTEASSAIDNWLEKLQNLIVEGRGLGVYAVITADRIAAITGRLQSAIGGRLILRHSDPANYMNYGIPSAIGKTLDLPPGRGLFETTTLVQIALAEVPADAEHQGAASVPDRSHGRPASLFASQPLPNHVLLPRRPRTRFEPTIDIGIADITGDRAQVDLAVADLAIVGHPGSGRTTAVETSLHSAIDAGYEVFVVSHIDSPLRNSNLLADLVPSHIGFDAGSTPRVMERLTERIARGDERLVLGIDDVDLVDDSVTTALEKVGRKIRLVGSADVRSLTGYSTNPTVARLKRARNLLFLQPDDPSEVSQLSGARIRIRPGVDMVPGRALLVAKRRTTLLQVAYGFEASLRNRSTRSAPVATTDAVSTSAVSTTRRM